MNFLRPISSCGMKKSHSSVVLMVNIFIPSYVSYYFENVNSATHVGCGCCCGVLGVGNAAWAQGKQHPALYLPFAHGDF